MQSAPHSVVPSGRRPTQTVFWGKHRRLSRILLLAGLAAGFGLSSLSGCSSSSPKKVEHEKAQLPAPRYAALPPRQNVPEFMKGTIFELCDVENKVPVQVSGYGLVVGLDSTGDNGGTPLTVRNFMIDEMVRHGFGTGDGVFRGYKPEAMIKDSRTAIVEVYAFLPPGARAGQRLDVFVQAVEGSHTKSLARGMLYMTDLSLNGVDPLHPQGKINTYAKARGPVFVNPSYASASTTQPSRANLRSGMIMNGGMVMNDRSLHVRVRSPELRVARAIERRVDQRFQDETTSKTRDEGIVDVLVPKQYNGDWEHFMGVVTHLYFDDSPGFGVMKAKALVQEALKPDALLQDISYCWEGIGPDAVPFIQPLYTHVSPDVAYAAARAGAFAGDMTAEQALMDMARADSHPFQVNAAKTLASLDDSPRNTRMLRELVSSKNTLVRIEAYRALAEREAPPIRSRKVRESFVLDQVPTDGPTLIYATRSGVPRIAIFGRNPELRLPIMFSALNDRFTIASATDKQSIVVFDRTSERAGGVQARMAPDLAELVYRLGGGSGEGFTFSYADMVGILQSLSEGQHVAASFVMQDPPVMKETIEDAPPIPEPADQASAAPAGPVSRK